MTLKEVVAMREPEAIGEIYGGGVEGCPSDYGYLNTDDTFDNCPPEYNYFNNDPCKSCEGCWNREFKEEVWPKENPHLKKTPSIVAYDEDGLYLDNGEKVTAPFGYKFNPDDIKKILEAGD